MNHHSAGILDRATVPGLDPHEILSGLLDTPRRLPCKLLYDAAGSCLFEQICATPEYYPTRTEKEILSRNIRELADLCGPDCLLIEFGSGASSKTRYLLDHLERPAAYAPVDISRDQLFASVEELRSLYPEIEILPVFGDYHAELPILSPSRPANRSVVFFPGSTIGNFEPPDAIEFLHRASSMAGPDAVLLIGVDLRKPRAILEAAYNDARGITAAFNLNILRHLNRVLGANFRLDQFRHRAIYNEAFGRIEMHLVSLCSQEVEMDGVPIAFEEQEFVVTEHSYKYTRHSFERIAARAGLRTVRTWTDQLGWFAVFGFVPR